jgi:CheY-like chemotaxis protein
VRDRPTVLVVEADPVIQALLVQTLDLLCHVVTAADGASGLGLALAQPPALVVLDVDLPSMDGILVCRRLKAHPTTHHIPVLLLTGSDTEETRRRRARADGYFTKPFRPTELLQRVANLLSLDAPNRAH